MASHAAAACQFGDAKYISDAATLLQQLSAPAPVVVPVAVSERLPGEGDCDAEGRCWFGTPCSDTMDSYWVYRKVQHYRNWDTHWLPYNSIPLPQAGEGQE
jgi:hypothetical protein